VLVSAVLVEFAPAPRVLPYVVLFVAFTAALAAALRMPEPVADRSRLRLSPQRPRVPAAVRRPFVLAGGAVLSSWSIGGLFLALGPQLGADVFGTTNHVVTAIALVLLTFSGAVAQLAFGKRASWIGAAGGSIALATGVLLIVSAAATRSPELFIAGAVVGGAGFGVAFLGGLRTLTVAIPAEHRASVMSAFYVVAYLSLSVPAVLAGIAVTQFGLEQTFEWFGSVVAALALLVAFEAWRTRPAAQPGNSVSVSSDGCATGLVRPSIQGSTKSS
jgi:predicted MFS family arabinose efflux permease